MTREEAIGRIQEHRRIHSKKEPFTPYLDEAFDMAITALKEETICPILSDDEVKQPCIKGPCGIERPRGKWMQVTAKDGEYYCYHKCTNCGQTIESGFDNPPLFNFCPNCGADMRKEGTVT